MHRTTTRFALGAGLLAAAAVLVLAVTGASAGGASVGATSVGANVGSDTDSIVRALNVGEPGLSAWTIDISYNPSVISISDCDPAGGGVCNPHFDANTLRTTGTNVYGLVGDTTLATVTVHCLTTGSTALTVDVSVFADATIGGPQPISHSTQNGNVQCVGAGQPTPTPLPGEPSQSDGDVNCDQQVNAVDAALILQYTAGLLHALDCIELADVNHDGHINSIDAALVLQQDAGLL